ncbi:HsdM family class I SAM-dependent methyltransferase [Legionella pneumophila]|uniref:HsdM family class I SAM-dependent methyltransferase n=4 Tax=Legionella pneumophila TaxID=446 RepID=UPI00077086FA|nr:N-6 DNA methylase [Legionella pneumophila]PYB42253.1 hypothetical protein DM454_16080 [Legionella pneumophila]PYB60769.1 hypothetical protein DM455_12615 [Legionella pneumophila]TID56582.1 hypothetical protein DIZ38_16735 [Legionella pneumophila]TID59164.1 hypothetical protein DIZ40_09415 [Legionella pneumophila]TID64236.1 hypothetical protein DIZ43_16080 [Legionella pneumophila]
MTLEKDKDLENQLWQLFNSLRAYSHNYESYIYWILALAVISKQSKEKYKKLIELDIDKKCDFVIKNSYCKDELSKNPIENSALESIIKFIAHVSDPSLLANELMNLLSGPLSKVSSSHFSDQLISEFIDKYISNENLETVYDGAAGYCFITSQIQAKHFALIDKNIHAKTVGTGIMLLKDKSFDYFLGDSLANDVISNKADLVICEPPFNSRLNPNLLPKIEISKYILSKDLENLPSSASNSLWIQNSLYHLNEQGKAIVILPHGWLFRGGYDALLREKMLELDVIEAIIGLPERTLKFTSIPPLILVLNKNKKNKELIHFVDASNMGETFKHQLKINDREMQSIVDMANGINTNAQHYRAVSLSQIKENDNNLSIKKYFIHEEKFSPSCNSEELEKLEHITKKSEIAQEKLIILLAEGIGK